MIDVLIGLSLGLLSATLSESFGHRIFGHPGPWQLRLYLAHPRFFAPFLRAYYHHCVIHHEKTFLDDVLVQFRDREHKAKVDSWIDSAFPQSFANLVRAERYNLTLKGVEGTLPFAIPFLTGPLVIGALFGTLAFAASLLTGFLPVLLSKYLHPVLHCPEELKTAPRLVQAIARTPYMKWVLKNHHLHHRYVETNYNLLLGGDRLLGFHRSASQEENEEFASLWRRFNRSWQES